MKKTMMSLVAMTLMAAPAFGALVNTTASTGTKIEGVEVAKEANVSLNGQELPVSVIGAGLRAKKVAIMTAKVYVVELLSSDASKFVRTEKEALSSLEQSRTIALRMTFVRKVDASDVQASYREALERNAKAQNPNQPVVLDGSVLQFLKAVDEGGDAAVGKTLTIVTQKNADGSETLTYEDSNAKLTTIQGAAGFSKTIMAIWLGETKEDVGLDRLKAALIKGL